jgi:CzcA family heavy metal efflux pump
VLVRILRWSLDRPRLVAWACVWLAVCALAFARHTQIAFLPPLTPAQATIQTEAPGLVAEQVEVIVTRPIESALGGTSGIANIHSDSVEGLSVVTLTFAPNADPLRVRQTILEKLSSLGGALPQGVAAPRLSPLSAAGGDVLQIGFTSDKLDPMGLRDVVEWTVRPRLLTVTGVARAAIYGGETRGILVRARPGDLSDSDLGFLDILGAVRRATGVAGAGFIDTPSQRVLIEPRGQALTADAIGAGQIQTPGSDPTRIGDVADVDEAPTPRFGDALIDGKPGVLMTIASQDGANVLDVTHRVEAALGGLQPALAAQGVQVHGALDRPASFIARAMRAATFCLAIGVLLIAMLLVLLMGDLRAALISLASIPLALLLAVVALGAFGLPFTIMTLGGLAVALGVVVDDAVIDIENILSRLRDAERRHASPADAILAASLEVRGPVIYATLAVIVVVLPLLFLPKAQSAVLAPLAGAIIAACLASLAIALLAAPALAFLALRHVRPPTQRPHRRLAAAHAGLLTRLGAAPRVVLAISAAMVAGAVVLLALERPAFLPAIHDDHLAIQMTAPPSTSLAAMRDYGVQITHDLQGLPGVASVVQRVGRDPTGEGAAGLESSRFDVALKPGLGAGAQGAAADRARAVFDRYPGLSPVVRTGFDADLQGPQPPAPFTVSIFGSDLDGLDATAAQVRDVLRSLPGGGSASIEGAERAPVVRVDLDFDRLAIYGLSVGDVLDILKAAFASQSVATIYEGDRAVDVSIAAQDSLRQDPEGVGDLLLRSSSGFSVPLRSVAKVYLTEGRASIQHDHGLRRDVVAVSPPGDLGRFEAAARKAISAKVKPAPGSFIEFARGDEAAVAAARALAIDYALALFTIAALLAIAFDGRSAALIMASALFSFVGGAAAVLLMGVGLSVGPIAGFIALFGVSMRNAILLISRIEDLVLTRRAHWSFATVVQATGERAAPLVMSAVLSALGLAPLALLAGRGGFEILGPMAVVILAGLLTGTLASLFLAPVLIFTFWRPGYARLARSHRTSAAPTS